MKEGRAITGQETVVTRVLNNLEKARLEIVSNKEKETLRLTS